jgi:hypothetical protein
MTTLTIFLLIIPALIICCFSVFLFAPVTLGAEFTFTASGRKGTMFMRFLHPSLAQWKYDIVHRRSEVRVLRWIRVYPEDEHRAPEQKGTITTTSVTSAASPVAEFIPQAAEMPRESRSIAENNQGTSSYGASVASKEQTTGYAVRFWQKTKYFLSILSDSRNRSAAVKTLRWCRRALGLCFTMAGLHRLRLQAEAGTGDPAETGKLYGYYSAFKSSFLRLHKNIDVRFKPEFSGNSFDCRASVEMRTSLTRILFPVFAALVTFPYFSVYGTWRRIKKSEYPEKS